MSSAHGNNDLNLIEICRVRPATMTDDQKKEFKWIDVSEIELQIAEILKKEGFQSIPLPKDQEFTLCSHEPQYYLDKEGQLRCIFLNEDWKITQKDHVRFLMAALYFTNIPHAKYQAIVDTASLSHGILIYPRSDPTMQVFNSLRWGMNEKAKSSK